MKLNLSQVNFMTLNELLILEKNPYKFKEWKKNKKFKKPKKFKKFDKFEKFKPVKKEYTIEKIPDSFFEY